MLLLSDADQVAAAAWTNNGIILTGIIFGAVATVVINYFALKYTLKYGLRDLSRGMKRMWRHLTKVENGDTIYAAEQRNKFDSWTRKTEEDRNLLYEVYRQHCINHGMTACPNNPTTIAALQKARERVASESPPNNTTETAKQ